MLKKNKKIKKPIVLEKFLIKKKLSLQPSGDFSGRKFSCSQYGIDGFMKSWDNISDEKNMETKLQEAEETIEGEKSKKKQSISWLFIFINLVVVVAIFINQLITGEAKPITELFAENPYYRYIFLAFGLEILLLIVEGTKFFQLIHKSTKRKEPALSFKIGALGKYWDCITPFGSGEQPFQIYYLRKHNFSGDVATSIPMAKYMFWQIAFLILGVFALIVPSSTYIGGDVVRYAAIVGLFGNGVLFAIGALISINKKIGSSIIVFGLKILHKLKIVKDYPKALKKVVVFMSNYQKSMRYFAKSPFQVISQVIYASLTTLLNAGVAYCIYLAFNPFGTIPFLQIISMAILCEFAILMVPIPGGSGVAEVSFIAMFSTFFREGTAFWALMIWRVVTYYFFMIIGVVILLLDARTDKKKNLPKPPAKPINILEEK